MLRRLLFATTALLVLSVSAPPGADQADAVQPINFVRGDVAGASFTTTNPTSLTVGPDGRLYVADWFGRIQALTLDPNTKAVAAVQQLTSNTDLQEVFGMAFDPADGSSLYVTDTISGFGDAGQAPAGSYPGKVTKLSGAGFATRTDIITGLPVSNSGHQANGLAFGPDGRLYIAQGSTTNAGVVNPNVGLFQRPEVPTSSAILVANTKAALFDGNITYTPPNVYAETVDQTGGDVSVYAPGFRNPYDLIFHSNGFLYETDNGPNQGYGPASTSCTTQSATDPVTTDELNLVEAGQYYGFANRNRGRFDARQCVFHLASDPGTGEYTAPLAPIPSSSNGLAEYTSNTFGGQMQGDLLYAGWNQNDLHRVILSADGRSVVTDLTLATNLNQALDVAVGPDGTVYVAEYGGNKITFLKPDETPVSSISVTGISPPGGPITGGQPVTITGTNFTTSADTTANIGGAPITGLVVHNSTTITGVTSASSAGLKGVTVTNSIATATLTNAYNYSAGGGTIPPVADAGPDQSTPIAHVDHAHVTIDGRASTDADGFITSYLWQENGVTLSTNPVDSVQMTLGTHLVTLTVTDNDNFADTDDVRIIVTATAENPEPYFCFDVDGNGGVDAADVSLVAADYNKRLGNAGYGRMRDWNSDRVVNSADILGTQQDYTADCPVVDDQVRAATVGMEQYLDINVAYAQGFQQITPYIPGMGRHMLIGGVAATLQQDTVFQPAVPESLLYYPDATRPGGWALGGAMYVIPVDQHPLPPDGFTTNADAWHYHEWLCIWNNGGSVGENISQAQCQSLGGVWFEKAGWLVHLWNFRTNPVGRFVEINDTLTQGPVSSSANVSIDANPGVAGVQTSRSGATGAMTVDVVASGVTGVGAFNFDLVYNTAVFSGPVIASGASTDRNPDANQSFLESSGRAFSCSPPAPSGKVAGAGTARIACTSTGAGAGVDAATPQVIATLTLNVLTNATNSPLSLQNVNMFNENAFKELASCNPTVSVTTACNGATVSTTIGPDSDGDGCANGRETGTEHPLGGDRDPAVWADFTDVPVPALTSSSSSGTRNKAITLSDVSATLLYVGTVTGNASLNQQGASYMTDRNNNGVLDGAEYDRTPSLDAAKRWRAGAPNGAVSLQDVSVILASVGDSCT